jgi:steroid delta-isomerase-like uncharacterized protein
MPLLIVLAAVLAAGSVLCVADDAAANKEVVLKMIRAMNDRDFEALDRYVAQDVRRHSEATPGVRVENLRQFKEFLEQDLASVPDAVQRVNMIFAAEDKVAVHATYSGTQTGPLGPFPPSGKPLEASFIGLLRLENGKIAEIWVEWDNMNILVQLGHVPPPQSDITPAQQSQSGEVSEPIPVSPVDGVLEAFDRFPIVALGEGDHGNLPGATFRLLLLRDPRFSEKVDDIVVEFGTGRHQAVMDRYIAGHPVPMESLRRCWQETTQPVIWDAPIYAEFFAAVRALNESLPEERRLRVLLGDPSIDWSRIRNREELENWYGVNSIKRSWGSVNARDGHAVDVIEREVLAKGRRALVIYGDMHFHRPEIPLGEGFFADYFRGNIVQQIERLHPGKVFSIMSLTSTDRLESQYPGVVSWPRPSLVHLKGTSVGALTIQGKQAVERKFDALLWLGPSSTIGYSEPSPDAVAEETYFKEALRRDGLWIGQYQEDLADLRQRYLQLAK